MEVFYFDIQYFVSPHRGHINNQTRLYLALPTTDMENAPLLPTPSNPPNPQLYSQRPDWADVTPVEQSDLANPLVPIFYPPDCE